MIRVRFDRAGGGQALSLEGHATGDSAVCAAASALVFALAGAVDDLPGGHSALESGRGSVSCPESPRAHGAFDVARAGFELLGRKYPELVEVSYGGRAGKIEAR